VGEAAVERHCGLSGLSGLSGQTISGPRETPTHAVMGSQLDHRQVRVKSRKCANALTAAERNGGQASHVRQESAQRVGVVDAVVDQHDTQAT
jgi:hypothetical protein